MKFAGSCRTPSFWSRDGLVAHALAPISVAVAKVTAGRIAEPPWHAPIPVFCAGNATVGGTGKTTLALELLRRLQSRGIAVHALLRGYGGREKGPLRVDPRWHDARSVGDEALLLAKRAPTWVAADRASGAKAAIAAGAEALVLDDGLQNPSLAKDCSLLVIDGAVGFGNGRVLPAGPLREPVHAAARRCQAAVWIGEDERNALRLLPAGFPVLRATLRLMLQESIDYDRPLIAFSGIGRPQKFFSSLQSAGLQLAGTHAFPDHHLYSEWEWRRLKKEAISMGVSLVTTAKDAVRLAPEWRDDVAVVDVSLVWEDEAALEMLLEQVLTNAQATRTRSRTQNQG